MSSEILFEVKESPEGGYEARSIGYSIFTETDSVEQLRDAVRDAVLCHFEQPARPKAIRLHFTRDEVIAI